MIHLISMVAIENASLYTKRKKERPTVENY